MGEDEEEEEEPSNHTCTCNSRKGKKEMGSVEHGFLFRLHVVTSLPGACVEVATFFNSPKLCFFSFALFTIFFLFALFLFRSPHTPPPILLPLSLSLKSQADSVDYASNSIDSAVTASNVSFA
ncbi:hypothetical protein BDB00DRAFT_835890 [Zychaea mexicana]|uniref:uncharacterized protein n=1 Tax=Zychaea mexicana TaxID=64656 RepID=UPI0022FEB29D|nr:uncharacterized protein BDB00DRAFT_835890 [Zychaea mexicana]KAI9490898.1 hypothetical protein BDB00DRAFT_835890 [Zychaea mexicana]